jgi:hypothetical protein
MGRNIALGAVLALMMASCDQPGRQKDTADDGPPPARFRGDAEVTVRFVTDVAAACRKAGLKDMGAAYPVNGCTITQKGEVPIIIERNPCKAGGLRSSLCHEIGHANGWPGDHPA